MAKLSLEQWCESGKRTRLVQSQPIVLRQPYGLETCEAYGSRVLSADVCCLLLAHAGMWVVFESLTAVHGTVYKSRDVALQNIADTLDATVYSDGLYFTVTNWD